MSISVSLVFLSSCKFATQRLSAGDIKLPNHILYSDTGIFEVSFLSVVMPSCSFTKISMKILINVKFFVYSRHLNFSRYIF